MKNEAIEVLMNRRSVRKFKPEQITDAVQRGKRFLHLGDGNVPAETAAAGASGQDRVY